MRLRRKQFVEAVMEFERLRQRVNILQRRLEHFERTVPGRCQHCGRLTDSPDVFYCSDSCTEKGAAA